MHSNWEGITKQFHDLWFKTKHHEEEWYIGTPTTISKVNNKLQEIKVPQNVRSPISIGKNTSWKGEIVIWN